MARLNHIPLRSLTLPYPPRTAITKARKEAGCTIKEMAEALYVPTQYIRDCEAGKKYLHPACAELFARKFKIGIYKTDPE